MWMYCQIYMDTFLKFPLTYSMKFVKIYSIIKISSQISVNFTLNIFFLIALVYSFLKSLWSFIISWILKMYLSTFKMWLLMESAFDLIFWCFNATFSSISVISAASRVHPFCNLQSRARTHSVLGIGLYELLDPTT
jgi:hypothetical protein